MWQEGGWLVLTWGGNHGLAGFWPRPLSPPPAQLNPAQVCGKYMDYVANYAPVVMVGGKK